MGRKGFTVKVTAEQKPKGGKEGHHMLGAWGLQVEGTANAKAMQHQCV